MTGKIDFAKIFHAPLNFTFFALSGIRGRTLI